MTQLAIDLVESAHLVRTDSGRSEPQIWVRALRIVRELGDDANVAVREVRLRRGLNVVWAPTQSPYASALFDDAGIAGHTAGKTSFCRLVRYILGERHFGNVAIRGRVRAHLPSGWVLAEVVVNGQLWGVARPFAIGAHPFCKRGATLDEIADEEDRFEFREYLDALSSALLPMLPAKRFPDSDAPITWEHIFPWLSRDQECRFAEFLGWRDPSSESDAPSLTAAQRQFLVRSVLGLISDAEREEQERNAHLVSERQSLAERAPLVAHQSRIDADRLARILGERFPGVEGLFGSASRDALGRWADQIRLEKAELAADDPRAAAFRASGLAVAAEANAISELRDVEQRLSMEQAALEQLDGRIAGIAQTALVTGLPPGRTFCNVPMSEAHARGCPIAGSRVVSLDERRGAQQPEAERLACLTNVDSLKRVREECLNRLKVAEHARTAANGTYLRALTTYDQRIDRIRAQESELREAERLVNHSEESALAAERAEREAKRLASEIDASYSKQEAIREQQRTAFGKLSVVFEHVVRALLGSSVSATIDSSGRSLALQIERNGSRESAALATVKLLAFDLAALTASAEGHGAFPRFLLHDGPREADLARDIYDRVFLYARELERAYPAEPGFQYILTTTTDPPAEFQTEPWLCLKLSGAESDSRLYRMDL